jgi:hypothetical protein
MWLTRRYPEIAAETATGHRVGWGARQEVNFAHAAYRFHAERVIRQVVGRYRDHPAMVGYQVDNEPGPRRLYAANPISRICAVYLRAFGWRRRMRPRSFRISSGSWWLSGRPSAFRPSGLPVRLIGSKRGWMLSCVRDRDWLAPLLSARADLLVQRTVSS